MTYDPEAAERLAKRLDYGIRRIGDPDPIVDAAALIRAQAAEIERLTARQPSPTPAPPAEPAGDALYVDRALIENDPDGWKSSAPSLRAALAAAPAPQPDADEREAMVAVVEGAILKMARRRMNHYEANPSSVFDAGTLADALIAAGWTRKREEG